MQYFLVYGSSSSSSSFLSHIRRTSWKKKIVSISFRERFVLRTGRKEAHRGTTGTGSGCVPSGALCLRSSGTNGTPLEFSRRRKKEQKKQMFAPQEELRCCVKTCSPANMRPLFSSGASESSKATFFPRSSLNTRQIRVESFRS